MSSPPIRTPVAGLSRRTAMTTLAVVAGTLVTGCSSDGGSRRVSARRGGGASRVVGQDPDVTLVALVVAGERFALDATTATIDRHGDLAALLAGARDAHQAHVTLLADAAPDQATGRSPSPTGTASPTADEATRSFKVPARPGAALRRLASMELDLSLADKRHAFAAESGAFARILASMAASAAQHAVLLGEATATPPERP